MQWRVIERLSRFFSRAGFAWPAFRRVSPYPAGSVGNLMRTDLLSVRPDVTVRAVLRYLRRCRPLPPTMTGVFVADRAKRLRGIIPLEKLATAQLNRFAGDLMDTRYSVVRPQTLARQAARLVADRDLSSVPVVDHTGRLIGQFTADDAVDVLREEGEVAVRRLGLLPARGDFLSGLFSTVAHRSAWLAVGLLGACLASLVVLQFESTISMFGEVVALAPVVASLGGVFAMQTATLTVRGLALGQIGEHNRARWLRRECLVGLLLGTLFGSVALLGLGWLPQRVEIGIAAAVAVASTFLLAAVLGVLVPTAIQRIGFDPVFAAGAITVATDGIAYALVLGLATWLLLN